MEELVVRLNACLPLLMATIGSDAGIEVDVFEVVVLRDIHRPRGRVGIEVERVVTCHAAHRHHRIGRKNVFVGEDADGFKVVVGLQLAPWNVHAIIRGRVRTGTSIRIVAIWHVSAVLLDQLIGNRVASEFVTGDHREMILRRELSLIIQRELSCGAVVGVVFGGWSIEIVVRHVSCPAEPHRIFPPSVFVLRFNPARGIAASKQSELPVKARLFVLDRIDHHHATERATILGRNACGVNRHGLYVVRLNRWAKTGRTVIGKWDAVDHKLRLIFGSSGVKDSVSFVEPAWFRVDQVLNGAARN